MKLRDYLLTLFMEESSEAIKAASKIIRHGKSYKFPKYEDMTTEDLFHSEFGDCLANIILLNQIGISVAPLIAESLLNKDKEVLKEMEYRINRLIEITEKNLKKLDIDKEEFKEFKKTVENKFSKAKNKLKDKEENNSRKILLKTY